MRSHFLRSFVQISPDCFVPRERLALDAEALASAATMLKADLGKAIGGMALMMGDDAILRICREVMAEDRGRPTRRRAYQFRPGGHTITARPALRTTRPSTASGSVDFAL